MEISDHGCRDVGVLTGTLHVMNLMIYWISDEIETLKIL